LRAWDGAPPCGVRRWSPTESPLFGVSDPRGLAVRLVLPCGAGLTGGRNAWTRSSVAGGPGAPDRSIAVAATRSGKPGAVRAGSDRDIGVPGKIEVVHFPRLRV